MDDINAQPTVFNKVFYENWRPSPDDFSLDLFAYHESIVNNFTIKRFPVKFGKRLSGYGHNESIFSKIKYSWKTILFSVELRKHLNALKKWFYYRD